MNSPRFVKALLHLLTDLHVQLHTRRSAIVFSRPSWGAMARFSSALRPMNEPLCLRRLLPSWARSAAFMARTSEVKSSMAFHLALTAAVASFLTASHSAAISARGSAATRPDISAAVFPTVRAVAYAWL